MCRNREWYLAPDSPCCWPSRYFRSSVSSLMHRWSCYWAPCHSVYTSSFCKPFKRHPMVTRSSEYSNCRLHMAHTCTPIATNCNKLLTIHFTETIWKLSWFCQRRRLRKPRPLALHMWTHFWPNWDDCFWSKTLSTPPNSAFCYGYWPTWDRGLTESLSPSSVMLHCHICSHFIPLKIEPRFYRLHCSLCGTFHTAKGLREQPRADRRQPGIGQGQSEWNLIQVMKIF